MFTAIYANDKKCKPVFIISEYNVGAITIAIQFILNVFYFIIKITIFMGSYCWGKWEKCIHRSHSQELNGLI